MALHADFKLRLEPGKMLFPAEAGKLIETQFLYARQQFRLKDNSSGESQIVQQLDCKMIVGITSRIVLEQTHWSVGYCEFCDRVDAIRYGDAVEKTYLNDLIPMSAQKVGYKCQCEWCGSAASRLPDAKLVRIKNWNYTDGVFWLFQQCAPQIAFQVPQFDSEETIRKLLNSVKKRTKIKNLSIRTGAILGAVLGAILLLLISLFNRDFPVQVEHGREALAIGIGLVLGSISGAVGEAIIRAPIVARRLIIRAIKKYHVDSSILEEIAGSYPRRIKNAVKYALKLEREWEIDSFGKR